MPGGITTPAYHPDTAGTACAQSNPARHRDSGTGHEAAPVASGTGAFVSPKLRVLVACEYSATVRDAFRARGFDAWSCDILPTEGDDRCHYQGDVLDIIGAGWDLLIAFPPCTDLAVSGARHFAAKVADGRQARALQFVQRLLDAPIAHIALENPVSIISSRIRKPDQIVHPWQFGHGETKATCLWLKNLPKLRPTNIVEGREPRVHRMAPGPNRWKERSRTYAGIAAAMSEQWGDYLNSLSRNPARKPGGTSLFSATGQQISTDANPVPGVGSYGGVRPCDGPAAVFDPSFHASEIRR